MVAILICLSWGTCRSRSRKYRWVEGVRWQGPPKSSSSLFSINEDNPKDDFDHTDVPAEPNNDDCEGDKDQDFEPNGNTDDPANLDDELPED